MVLSAVEKAAYASKQNHNPNFGSTEVQTPCRDTALADDFPRNVDIDSDNYEAAFEAHRARQLPSSNVPKTD